jgi:serine/threonine protein kinase
MLYEMVTGARAFAGTSTAETLSAVIRAQPKAPSAVVPDVPSDLEKVILRCLRKDPQRRFQHIDDVKIALLDIKEESDSGAVRPAAVGRRRRTPLILLIAATVVLMSVAVAWLLRPSLRPAESAPMRLLSLTTVTGLEFDPTFRPTASRWRSHGMVPRRTIGTSTSPSSGRQMCADSRATLPRTISRGGRPTAARSRSCGSDPTAPLFRSCRRSGVPIGSSLTSAAPLRLAGLRMGSGSLQGGLPRKPGNHEASILYLSRAVIPGC